MNDPSLFSLLFFLLVSSHSVLAQQPYEVNNPQLNCNAVPKSTTVLGYFCNSPLRSCPTYFTLRSQPPFTSPSLLSSLLNSSVSASNLATLNLLPSASSAFPLNDLVLVPASCSCATSNGSPYYQHDAAYTIKTTGETYFTIANDTYQGLSTCQSLIAQNPYDSHNLVAGMTIKVPLRCACPTANQTKNGTKYLLSYLVTWGDDVPTISQRFKADYQSVLDANSLSSGDVIYPFTTILIPLKSEPSKDETLTPPPPAASPAPPAVAPPSDGGGGSGTKWVFVGIGIGAGLILLCAVGCWYYFCCFRHRRRPRQMLDEMPVQQGKKAEESSKEYSALSGKASSDPFMPSEIRGFIESLMVYKFGDLEKATGFFGEEHRIKGSVYRAVINGDAAAVKRLKGDVSNEIKILKQINHSNVVRLSGFCVHEGNTYLVYEFADKGSLADWLHHEHEKDWSDSVLSWKHRVTIAYGVADGLNYLHNYTNPPYIHKNLKSSNILLDGEFRAKLANFGLARPVEEHEEPQLTRHVVGTQGYMAPEYLEHGLITPKLDVFAFGVVILELLSGKEATFAKDGEEKGELLLWAAIGEVMRGEDVRTKLKDFIDPRLGNSYPFDLVFATAELAMRQISKNSQIAMAPDPKNLTAKLLPSASDPDANEEECAYDSDEKVLISISDEDEDGQDPDATPPFSLRKLWRFTGPGFLMCIAFLDPGNLEGDLQAGAIAGYSLLWLTLWATVMGLLIQLLSARLGVATGRHLAELCREEYPRWATVALWVMAELALIGADIQEVIGSAIAIKILSGGVVPLWGGVIITALDCFIFLFLENYGVRKLEAFFGVLIATMAVSFAIMFGETKPSGKEILIGVVVPKLGSKTIKQAVGVVGCLIMPHNVFLHSALVQSRRIDTTKKGRVQEALNYYGIESATALFVSFIINILVTTVFAKGFYGTDIASTIGLENAGQFLQEKYGTMLFPILYIWGLGLLASGQSSTITGTYAGQFIMGGFLNLRLKKWVRALITRSFAIVPTIIVALAFDTSGPTMDALNESLNVLQSVQVPFALIPLLTLVSKEEIMGIFKISSGVKILTWIIAAFLIAINGYLLLDFFSSSVHGLLLGSIVCAGLAVYVAFVVYLILYNTSLSACLRKSLSRDN